MTERRHVAALINGEDLPDPSVLAPGTTIIHDGVTLVVRSGQWALGSRDKLPRAFPNVTMLSPDGSPWRLQVDDAGALSAVRVTQPNDTIATAAAFTGSATGSTIGAAEDDNFWHAVWYTWVADSSTPKALHLTGVDPYGNTDYWWDTNLAVYTSTVPTPTSFADLTLVSENDNTAQPLGLAAATFSSLVTFTPTQGTQYWFYVADYDAYVGGDFLLELT